MTELALKMLLKNISMNITSEVLNMPGRASRQKAIKLADEDRLVSLQEMRKNTNKAIQSSSFKLAFEEFKATHTPEDAEKAVDVIVNELMKTSTNSLLQFRQTMMNKKLLKAQYNRTVHQMYNSYINHGKEELEISMEDMEKAVAEYCNKHPEAYDGVEIKDLKY